MPRPSRPSHLLLPALLCVAGCGRGCQETEPLTGTRNRLLVRSPEAVFEELGVLVPTAEFHWGDLGLAGWRIPPYHELLPLQDADAAPYADSLQQRAVLELPAGEPRDRELVLSLFCPAPLAGVGNGVRVELNGTTLGKGELTPQASELRLFAPKEVWNAGKNLLQLETEADPKNAKRWNTFRIDRIDYGSERRVQLDLQRPLAELAAGTGLRYEVFAPTPAELFIEGRCDKAGTLSVTFDRIEPRTGRADEPLRVFAKNHFRAGRFGERIRIPQAAGLVRIDLSWSSEAEGALVLESLEVIGGEVVERPPVVFISVDTLSASHTSIHGYDLRTTPRLEELAAESVVFYQCLVNAPWTMPSYLSVMTGLYPQSHRLDLELPPGPRQSWDTWQIADSRLTLAEMLRARGYRTAAWVDTLWLSKNFRVAQGFDHYDMEAAEISIADPRGGIGLIHHKSRQWLDTLSSSDPYFLFVHALDAHGPYIPGDGFEDRFPVQLPREQQTLKRAGSAFQTYRAIPVWMATTLAPPQSIPEEMPLEPIVAKYDEAILKTDEYIGKIFDELKQRDLYDQAIIVISADHGESFEHEFFSHGAMWQDIVNVPLIIKLPRGMHGGTRVHEAVQLVDVFPTIMDLVSGGDGGSLEDFGHLHGRSLVPLIRGEELPDVPIYASGGHCKQFMLVHDGWKLIQEWPGLESEDVSVLTHPRIPDSWYAQHIPELLERPLTDSLLSELRKRPEYGDWLRELRGQVLAGPFVSLYHVQRDPGELFDKAEEQPELVEKLLELLEAEKQRELAAQGDVEAFLIEKRYNKQELEELRKLGYIGEDEDS